MSKEINCLPKLNELHFIQSVLSNPFTNENFAL